MDQITAVERELLVLGVPASLPAEELRHLAKDILWEALELKSAEALTGPLAAIQSTYEIPYNPDDCERIAASIWDMAHGNRS